VARALNDGSAWEATARMVARMLQAEPTEPRAFAGDIAASN